MLSPSFFLARYLITNNNEIYSDLFWNNNNNITAAEERGYIVVAVVARWVDDGRGVGVHVREDGRRQHNPAKHEAAKRPNNCKNNSVHIVKEEDAILDGELDRLSKIKKIFFGYEENFDWYN